ncbi:hypothetical protein HaLaN_26665, partial [Haematococcus lacustris]
VEYLRAEMNTEIVALFNVVRAREAQLAAARAARRRMLTSAVAALWRRRALDTLTAVVCAWVSLTGRKRLWRSLGVVELHQGGRLCLQLLQQRLEQQVLGHALAAWLAMAQGKGGLAAYRLTASAVQATLTATQSAQQEPLGPGGALRLPLGLTLATSVIAILAPWLPCLLWCSSQEFST